MVEIVELPHGNVLISLESKPTLLSVVDAKEIIRLWARLVEDSLAL